MRTRQRRSATATRVRPQPSSGKKPNSSVIASILAVVEIADTDETRERGLMFRQRLPEGHGMLFDFGEPRPVSMWMKNTYIPLDMLFVRPDGTIAYIAENTVPKSLDTIGITEPVLAVIELAGGTARKKNIRSGDKVYHRIFNNAEDEPAAPAAASPVARAACWSDSGDGCGN